MNPQKVLEGEAPASRWAEALEAAPGGQNNTIPDHILGDLEAWKSGVPLEVERQTERAPRAGQSRRGSLLESLVNILVGASINYAANLLIFPLFGWHLSAQDNVLMVFIYTGISLVRSYGLRRLFNHKEFKK